MKLGIYLFMVAIFVIMAWLSVGESFPLPKMKERAVYYQRYLEPSVVKP